MLSRLFPKQFDNDYQGGALAIWLLIPLALLKLVQGANVAGFNPMVSSRHVLETADRVPIGEYPAEAAAHLVFIFAAWGLGVFLLGLLGVISLIRYRAMIPLVYLLLLIEQLWRKALSMIHFDRPFVSFDPNPANIINWIFLIAIVIGLAASLSTRRAKS